MEMRDGSYVMHMWENPTYQLFSEVWIFNYTNVPEYLDGTAKKLRVEEVGPFIFQREICISINHNLSTVTKTYYV
ncbi:hypothetical protein MSG28_008319 [Choristoneura fumiferana]|uniref:Uncharacterized protein n=1 Tax=Choristoneura fumiferana TaxID=7141 RepID=A0ACC0JAX0_CHOFU|nr:hypothetical protein MSG28_008319 [Choristoneura fumiferana]